MGTTRRATPVGAMIIRLTADPVDPRSYLVMTCDRNRSGATVWTLPSRPSASRQGDHVAEPLRAGDTVRVRTKEEILGTLDESGRLGALPFMPEMLAFAGQEL